MESANHSLSYTIPQLFPARGRALNNMAAAAWRSQGLVSDRENLGQSAIGIALYQELSGTHGYFPGSDQLSTRMTGLHSIG